MNDLPKLIINNGSEIHIDNIFEKFLIESEEYNSRFPWCWEKTVFELYKIIKTWKKNPFDENITAGIMYLFSMIWHTVCKKCDEDVNNWFYKLAMAWLLRDEPPIFVDCTCDDNSLY